jgi:hypothetical protein
MAKKKDKDAAGIYGTRFRQEAKAIFMQVRTLPETVKELKRRGYNHPPHKNTIKKWRDAENWLLELARRDEIMEPDHDPNINPLDALIEEISTMRKVARQKIMDKAGGVLEIKDSNSQDFYAYNQLAKTHGQLMENKRRAEAAEAQAIPVKVIFGALMRHKKIGKLLEKQSVLKEIEQIIAEEMLDYQKKAVGL